MFKFYYLKSENIMPFKKKINRGTVLLFKRNYLISHRNGGTISPSVKHKVLCVYKNEGTIIYESLSDSLINVFV
jgi:hypothetical protein